MNTRRTFLAEGSRDSKPLRAATARVKVPTDSHLANFLKCLRTRRTSRAGVDEGFQHAFAGCTAAMSLETVRKFRFDAQEMEIV